MSSGNRSVLIALLERADPADILKLQALLAQYSGEITRWLTAAKIVGAYNTFPGTQAAYAPSTDPTVPTDEVAHSCLSGLMVVPHPTYLEIQPGAAAFYQPLRAGLTADDTPWIVGSTTGLNDAAQLTFLANAGPGIRWDIIECQIAADSVESTAGRELFDPVANVFNPATVNKIQHSAFTFRVRRGTQGAGVPAIDADWMPIAAVHVRTDATSYDNSDIYDLRPLIYERTPFATRHPLAAPSAGNLYKSVLYEAEFRAEEHPTPNGMLLRGYFRGHFGGYWSGGEVEYNLPATNLADFGDSGTGGSSLVAINYENADLRQGAFALTANQVITLGCFFPRGYPRWVRYSQVSQPADATTRLRTAGRYPRGPRGILFALAGEDANGLGERNGIINPATMPAAFGETTGAWGHVVQYAITNNAGDGVLPAQGNSFSNYYAWQNYLVTEGGALTPSIATQTLADGPTVTGDLGAAAPAGSAAIKAVFTPGANRVPISASAVHIDLLLGANIDNAGQIGTVTPLVAYEFDKGFGQAIPAHGIPQYMNDGGGAFNAGWVFSFMMPLVPNLIYGGVAAPSDMGLAGQWIGAGINSMTGTTRIHGYAL